jgi:hypothetical protein
MDLRKLGDFLTEHGRDSVLTCQAMRIAEIFSGILVSRTYKLALASELDAKEIAGAISAAIDKPVKQVIFVSASAPDPKLFGDKDAHEGRQIFSAIDFTLWDHIHSRHHLTLWEGFPRERRDLGNRLWETLHDVIGAPLKDAILNGLPRQLCYDFRLACQNNLWHPLFYYVAFAMNGNTERLQRLAALVELLPRIIPLGDLRRDKSIWYVLTA